MEPQFWHDRWDANQIGFHAEQPNALLVRHLEALALAPGARVFLPLCGKTRDIGWLMAQGLHVLGAELSRLAIDQLFAELQITPEITQDGSLTRYAAPGIDIFVGDIFDLAPAQLGDVDAVYDRAALVALPAGMREDYVAHLTTLVPNAPFLLICFTYDQSAMNGPPFSIDADLVAQLLGAHYDLTELQTIKVPDGLKGQVPATETIWHVTPNGV